MPRQIKEEQSVTADDALEADSLGIELPQRRLRSRTVSDRSSTSSNKCQRVDSIESHRKQKDKQESKQYRQQNSSQDSKQSSPKDIAWSNPNFSAQSSPEASAQSSAKASTQYSFQHRSEDEGSKQQSRSNAEDAESASFSVDAESETMSEMCVDRKRGRKSSKFDDMEAIERQKRRDAKERRRRRKIRKLRVLMAQQAGMPFNESDLYSDDDLESIATASSAQLPSSSQKSSPLGSAGAGGSAGPSGSAAPLAAVAVSELARPASAPAAPFGAMADLSSRAPQVAFNPTSGKLEVLAESTVVDREDRAMPLSMMPVREEDERYKTVNASTHGKREKTDRWTQVEEQRFWKAISEWGTDFELMSKIFPGRSRAQLKRKFLAEERRRPELVDYFLSSNRPIDIEEYNRLSGWISRSIASTES